MRSVAGGRQRRPARRICGCSRQSKAQRHQCMQSRSAHELALCIHRSRKRSPGTLVWSSRAAMGMPGTLCCSSVQTSTPCCASMAAGWPSWAVGSRRGGCHERQLSGVQASHALTSGAYVCQIMAAATPQDIVALHRPWPSARPQHPATHRQTPSPTPNPTSGPAVHTAGCSPPTRHLPDTFLETKSFLCSSS